jgi:hypothetical protein
MQAHRKLKSRVIAVIPHAKNDVVHHRTRESHPRNRILDEHKRFSYLIYDVYPRLLATGFA